MSLYKYSNEKNTLMLIKLLKENNIRNIIASPGTTNINFVVSVQRDSFFCVYSAADERSAAYMACGMAAETKEPVVISCTGATASRNYIPALTEAYYRKLPILAVTSTQHCARVGQLIPQVIDRTEPLKDIANLSVQIPIIESDDDEWNCNVLLNKAILELKRKGGGPVHVNLTTSYNTEFSTEELPNVRCIQRYSYGEVLPEIKGKKIAVFVGSHLVMSERQTEEIDKFCEKYNAIVLCDHISNYYGKYRVFAGLILGQTYYDPEYRHIDLMIHIGEVSDYALDRIVPDEVWRVSPDGEIRDTFKKLKYVFEMKEEDFFDYYSKNIKETDGISLKDVWVQDNERLLSKIPELPFSNIWIAQNTTKLIPKNSVIHFAILNSARAWSFFEMDSSITRYCNTGGFGIDGCVSTLIGASLVNPNKLYFEVVGDLAFFYDMNSIGNHHVGNNIRILVVNNGRGQEFRNYSHKASMFGEDADKYIAAAGHYGNKSKELLKHYAEDLGFLYISAQNKEEYSNNVKTFVDSNFDKSIIFEIFTDTEDESNALKKIRSIESSSYGKTKSLAKDILGEKGSRFVKKIIKG